MPANYPELAHLCWNRGPRKPIAGEEAFALYERNWRHVHRDNLTQSETDLIQTLTEKFGNGFLLVP